jgi:AcrR family transcriptional regulator
MVAFENPSHATERLVAAAVACIGRDGIDAVTTRAIAREAGMNIAAVNYYFASKDALLEIALERALEAMLTPTLSPDVFSTPAAKRDPRGALFDAVDDMLAASARQPKAVFAQLKGPIADQDYSAAAVTRMNSQATETRRSASSSSSCGRRRCSAASLRSSSGSSRASTSATSGSGGPSSKRSSARRSVARSAAAMRRRSARAAAPRRSQVREKTPLPDRRPLSRARCRGKE